MSKTVKHNNIIINGQNNNFTVDRDAMIGIIVSRNGITTNYKGRLFKVNSRRTSIGLVGYEASHEKDIKEFIIKCDEIEDVYVPVIATEDRDLINYLTNTAKEKEMLKPKIRELKSFLNWLESSFTLARENFAEFDRGPGVEAKTTQIWKEFIYDDISFSNGKEVFELESRAISSIRFYDNHCSRGAERVFVGEVYDAKKDSLEICAVGYFEDTPFELQALNIKNDSVISVERKLLSYQLTQVLNLHSEHMLAWESYKCRYNEATNYLKELKERERKIKEILKA